MKQTCKFCKSRDITEVVPGLSVDLQAAIDTGVVLDTGVIEEYNNIESPDCIHVRVRDTFHALELKKQYLNAGTNVHSSLSGSTEHSVSTVNSSSGSATAGE